MLLINPQTTVRGPDPAQHSDSCKSETENDLAGTLKNVSCKRDCGVQWTPVESEMGVIFLGSMKVKGCSSHCRGYGIMIYLKTGVIFL